MRLAFALLCTYLPTCAVTTAAAQPASYIDSTTRKTTPVETAKPLPVIGKQESFKLVASNVPSAAVMVAGGDYILSQTCTGYGTVSFQVLGPDATTWLPLGSYTTSDTGSGHGFPLGSYAQVRISLSGTSGCNAILSRVPA